MIMNRMRYRMASLAVLGFMLVAEGVTAQSYPARPIRIVVPTSPGGGNDFVARHVGQKLGNKRGRTQFSPTVLLENCVRPHFRPFIIHHS